MNSHSHEIRENKSKYAEVVLDLSHQELDRAFYYVIPNELAGENINIGSRVIVPFGFKNRKTEAIVIGIVDTVDFDASKIKEIIEIIDNYPMLTKTNIELAKWLQNKYFTSLNQCLRLMIPAGIKMKNEYVYSPTELPANELIEIIKKLTKKQKEVFDYIHKGKNVSERELLEVFGNLNIVKKLEEIKIIQSVQISKIKDLTIRVNYVSLSYNDENFEQNYNEIINDSKNEKQLKVLELIKDKESIAVSDIKTYLNISDSPIKTLVKKGLVKIEQVVIRRNAYGDDDLTNKTVEFTKEQKDAYDILSEEWKNINTFEDYEIKPTLIHGVTGSGKTELYMALINLALKEGKEAIVLVPEISLTPQAVSVFVGRFGNKVSITHSRLSLGERFDQWEKARNSEISIIIGPRSALFTPFRNLGLIIIDEEHEYTYQSETSPKYHAIDVAKKLAILTKSMLVVGSATPSMDTFYKATQSEVETNSFNIVSLKDRVNKTMPDVEILDMRIELAEGNKSIFSRELYQSIEYNIENKLQTILFLNRRGYASFVSCRACGNVLSCDECRVNYTYHMNQNNLVCHYCGKTEKNPTNCPVCGSKYIKHFGVGTQRVEKEVEKYFPNAKTLRMDMDTTSGKSSHKTILNAFKNGEADILIGTQMIAKGLDFPKVTLVGVIAADISINSGDFRNGEKTFQLLTQVSGRAGRGELKGKVIIQTYQPDHYAIVFAKDSDYLAFYEHEISLRRQSNYPPFTNIFQILATGDNEKELILTLNRLVDFMKSFAHGKIQDGKNTEEFFEVLGATPAVISKIKNKFRWHIVIKGKDEEILKNTVIESVNLFRKKESLMNIQLSLFLNPLSMY